MLNRRPGCYGFDELSAWASPRTTEDVDLVLMVPDAKLVDTVLSLRQSGFEFPVGCEQTLPIDGWTRGTLGGRHVDLLHGVTDFDRAAYGRRVVLHLFDRDLPLASAEDLILYKLVAFRLQDLADVEAILRRQRAKLDLAYLRRWGAEIAARTSKFEVPQKLEEMLERFYRRA